MTSRSTHAGTGEGLDSIVRHLDARASETEPSRLVVATAEGADFPLDAVIPALLAAVKHTLNMDVAFVSEFVGDMRVFKHVAPASGSVIAVGGADPFEASWCKLVVQRKLPQYIPDTAVHYARGDVQPPPFPIGTHLSVPITLEGGHHFGTLCCFSYERRPEAREGAPKPGRATWTSCTLSRACWLPASTAGVRRESARRMPCPRRSRPTSRRSPASRPCHRCWR